MIRSALEFIKQLVFVDQRTQRLSHTKWMSILASLVLIGLFPYVVINRVETSVELWLVFGALFLGNRQLALLIDKKYGGTSK